MRRFIFFTCFVCIYISSISIAQTSEAKLAGKSIVMIISDYEFRDEELLEPKAVFEKEGASVTIASKTVSTAIGMLGAKVKPDLQIKDLDVKNYDAVIFVGGIGAEVYFSNPIAHKIAQQAYANEKIVAAICIAPNILANAGILKDKKATCWPGQENPANLKKRGAIYTGNAVERDGRIITGSGPYAAMRFGKAIVSALIE